VYDRHDRAGGLLIYGSPNFKLEKSVVLRRGVLCEESDIRFRLNCAIGQDIELAGCIGQAGGGAD
jgi:glutamate synthase (NADPH) small chain